MLTLQTEGGSLAQCQHWRSRGGSLGLTGRLVLANRWAPRLVRDRASQNKVESDQGTHPMLMYSHSTKEYTPSLLHLHTHGHINSYPYEHIHITQTQLLLPSWTQIHTTHSEHVHTCTQMLSGWKVRLLIPLIVLITQESKFKESIFPFYQENLCAYSNPPGFLLLSWGVGTSLLFLHFFRNSFSVFWRLNPIIPFSLSLCESFCVPSMLPFHFMVSFH